MTAVHAMTLDLSILGAITFQAGSDADALMDYVEKVKRSLSPSERRKAVDVSALLRLARERLAEEGTTGITRRGVWKTLEPEMIEIEAASRHVAERLPEGLTRTLCASPFFVYFAAWMLKCAIHAQAHLHADVVLRHGGELTDSQHKGIAEALWRCRRARKAGTRDVSAS